MFVAVLAQIGLAGGLGAGIGGLLSLAGGLLGQSAAKRQRSRLKKILAGTFQRGKIEKQKAQEQFLSAPEIAAGLKFLQERFANPLAGGLGQEFQNRIRAAQSIRGLAFGGSPSIQEASFLTRLSEQQRERLLPQLGTLRLQAENLGERAFSREFGFGQALAGLPFAPTAADILSQTTQGALGGFQAGAGFQQFQQQNNIQDLLQRSLLQQLGG